MARLHVFISTSSFGKLDPEPFHRLKANGITFHTNPFGRTLSEGEIAQFIMNVDGIIAGTEPLTRAVLSQATRLKVISRCGVGLDNVDLEAAKELDIVVTNTSHAHDRAVAELTIVLAPTMERQGVASLAEIGCETLVERIVEDASKHRSMVVGRAEIGAWTRIRS